MNATLFSCPFLCHQNWKWVQSAALLTAPLIALILILMTEKWATEQSYIHIEITSCKIPSFVKLHILWEDHNFFWNLQRRFVLWSCNGQMKGEDFAKFCGLLRMLNFTWSCFIDCVSNGCCIGSGRWKSWISDVGTIFTERSRSRNRKKAANSKSIWVRKIHTYLCFGRWSLIWFYDFTRNKSQQFALLFKVKIAFRYLKRKNSQITVLGFWA